METKQINKIRRLVAQARVDAGTGRIRYSKTVKESVLSILQLGHTITEVSRLTGIQSSTLFKWSGHLPSDKKKFRRVEVSGPEVVASEYRVTLPGGVRVECVGIESLRILLEEFK